MTALPVWHALCNSCKPMRIAIPVWEDRVSPVFDVARRLVVVDVTPGNDTRRSEIDLPDLQVAPRVRHMAMLGVEVLICGAISRPLEAWLSSAGIRVVPHTCGPIDGVLQAFLNGQLNDQAYLMPGCCRRRRRGRGGQGWRWQGTR